ncbi:MAG TPA: catalase family peroxidase [Acidobacteriaceae bacterium]
MPLPADEKLVALSNDLIAQFDTIFGEHPGFRPAHAKGAMLTGVFTPYVAASALTRAPHMQRASTPVTVRFSNSTGLPLVPDNDPNANPRGMAVRFHLAEHSHTDIVSHSTDGFPTRTGAEFLEFLKALASSDLAAPPDPAHPKPIEVFLGSHPAALKFVQTPKPAPSSFAREAYFGVTAMAFLNQQGLRQFGRYQIVPETGVEHLDDATVAAKDGNYLFDEVKARVAAGPIRFRISVQLANAGEVVNDATIHWAANSKVVDLGTLVLTAMQEESAEQKRLIFDPIPRVDGIEASNDPLLELRAAVYLISGRRRRSAG